MSFVTPPGSERDCDKDSLRALSFVDNGSLSDSLTPGEEVSMMAVRENAARMLETVQKRSQKMGVAFAHIIGDLQLKSKRQMQAQVKHLEVHNEAVTHFTTALNETVTEMDAVVKNVNFLDVQLEQMSMLCIDVNEVYKAVKELDKVVVMLEKKHSKV